MSWPFSSFEAPDYLDGTLAGDAGFDPLRLAANKDGLYQLREAEIKHCRIAMLAAFGWPVSELYHYQIAQSVGLDSLLAVGGKAPSVLNGGLDNVFALLGLGLFFAVGGVLEFELIRRRKEAPPVLKNFFDMWREDGWDSAGNYGFDPLGLGERLCSDDYSKQVMQAIEVLNGRIAMLATVGFVVQEFVTGMPVVTETPQFFKIM
mmetsp:Transcript_29580/g.42235  ORF Transcript_29580/g.42235 Transcript_29580/m.42235 type:complete len:205 (+) Transcript_29580:21-635(+)